MSGGGRDVGAYRAALGYSLLSDGIPIVYYGSEWLFAGGADPGCREPLWSPGISYNATAAPLGGFLNATNAYRRAAALWEARQAEAWSDDTLYAFARGPALAAFTNVGSGGPDQSRAIGVLPADWADGTRACNVFECGQCATVAGGAFVLPPLRGRDGVAVYDAAYCNALISARL
jgi:alpha-amylase